MKNDEQELMAGIRQKDRKSFEAVVRLYTTQLYRACLGLGFQKSEAEDVTQSTWITFFDVAPGFEGRSSIRTFLFGILYNKASEYRKQNKRAAATEDIEKVVDAHFDERGSWLPSHVPVSPERFLESTQTRVLISQCLDLLPLKQKMAFVLKEVEEETSEHICSALGITASNLGVLLFRARNQLRECIDRKSR